MTDRRMALAGLLATFAAIITSLRTARAPADRPAPGLVLRDGWLLREDDL